MLDLTYKTKFLWDESLLKQSNIVVDLVLFKDGFDFDDQIRFQVLGNILETLCQKAVDCKQILLYQGPLNWLKFAAFSPSLERRYAEWLEDLFGHFDDSKEKRIIFAVNVFLEYLHRIASFGHDHIQFNLAFTDLEEFDKALLAVLLSKNRFTHFEILDAPFEGDVGFILPKDALIDIKLLQKISKVLKDHDNKVRFIPEEMIPQMWHELNTIYAVEEKLTKFGKRGILGFEAAEGEVLYI